MSRSCRIERATPSSQPPKCSWISPGSAEGVADGGAGEAADGPVGQQVSAH